MDNVPGIEEVEQNSLHKTIVGAVNSGKFLPRLFLVGGGCIGTLLLLSFLIIPFFFNWMVGLFVLFFYIIFAIAIGWWANGQGS